MTLQQLIAVTPIPKETKTKALEKLPLMSTDEQFELQKLCWKTIADICELRIKVRVENEIYKASTELRQFAIDTNAIEDEVVFELMNEIAQTETHAKLQEVKNMLKRHLTKTKLH